MKDDGKRKPETMKELIEEYQRIRKQHGEKAKSVLWLNTHGKSRLYYHIGVLGLSWDGFKKKAGYSDTPKRRRLELKDLIKEYQQIRKKHGDKAKSCKWMRDNGYCWLHAQARRKAALSWDEFKRKAGYSDGQLCGRAYRGEVSLEDLVEKYRKIREKHGDKSDKVSWLLRNGYGWIYQRMHRKYNLSWSEFKKKAE